MGSPQAGRVPDWSLRDRLRKARETAHLTQQQLATMMGVARSSVVNYETGRGVPGRPVLLSWAVLCGVNFDWLAGSPHPGVSNVEHSTKVRKPGRCTTSKALPVAA
jgi:transcriptional regulator with XRE-family HTH domain